MPPASNICLNPTVECLRLCLTFFSSFYQTALGSNWKQMENDENFLFCHHGSLAFRTMVHVFKTFLLPNKKIKIDIYAMKKKRETRKQTFACMSPPFAPFSRATNFYFRFQFQTEACWICQETHVRFDDGRESDATCWIVFGTDK